MRAFDAKFGLSVSISAMALAFGMVASEPASALVCAWNGGNGAYGSATNWSCGNIPGGTDDVSILTAGSVVNVVNAVAGTLNVGTGNIFNVASGGTMYIQNQAITNNGTINVANNSDFRSNNGMVNVTGTGTFIIDDSIASARLFGGGFAFGAGQTVRGSGQLGLNQTLFTNAGLISSDVLGRNLSIDVTNGSVGLGGAGVGTGGLAGLYNSGTMQAANGGTLSFENGRYENAAGGIIQALAGSTVSINSDARIVGGTLKTVGTGSIITTGGTEYLQDVTLSSGSKLTLTGGSTTYLNTSFVNNGLLTVSNNTDLRAESALVISGTGTIKLEAGPNTSRIFGNSITFASNHTINGDGQLGLNQTLIANNGLLTFGGGGNISIDVTNGSGGLNPGEGVGAGGRSGLFNNAIMQVTGGGVISFESGRYENGTGAIMRALNGSKIMLNSDARIVGGTLTSDATSTIDTTGGTEYLSDVTLSSGSRLNVNSNNTLFLDSTFMNNGTVFVGANSDLRNQNGGLLAMNGVGSVLLGGGRVFGGTITFGAGQTLQGSGQLGLNQTLLVINNVFSANAGTTLSIDVTNGSGGLNPGEGVGASLTSGLLNNSTIQSTGGSTLSFESGRYENAAGGVIQALNGSTVLFNSDVRIVGGTLTTAGTGAINTTGGTEYLQAVTLSSGSKLSLTNGSTTYLNTSLINNGLVTVSNNTDLRAENALVISGTGTIKLEAGVNASRLFGNTITFATNHTITGNGQLGLNQTLITNNGLLTFGGGGNISIDVTNGSGGFNPGDGIGVGGRSGLFNNAIMQVTGGSGISFESGRYENGASGIIRALDNSTITLNSDARIVGGTLTSDATSSINTTGGTEYLSNVTLSSGSRFNVNATNTVYLDTSLTNNGVVYVGSNSDLRNENNVTLNGTGIITLDDLKGASRYYSNTLIIGAGQTINGSGQLGANQTIMTNNGSIFSTVDGRNFSIDSTNGSAGFAGDGVGTGGTAGLFNTGKIGATTGASLSFESGRYENSSTGTFSAIGAGATVNMNSDANLVNLLSGDVLSLGRYISSTTGAASTLNLRGAGANAIATIGTAAAVTDTVVTLSGINSALNVTNFNTSVNSAIDSTLTGIAKSGRLELLGNRSMTIVAGGGAFSNAGILQLGGGTFGASSFANSGFTTGFGGISVNIGNSGGIVEAAGGTLSTRAITGTTGTIRSLAGATLDMSGALSNSTAGVVTNDGALNIGSRRLTVTSDYQNASFGTGNAFNAHANVAGSGLIFASSATMDLSGPALVGNVLNVGSVRTGGSSSTILTITNNGTLTTLRGAVQNANAPSVSLSGADWVIGANGGSTNVTLSYTGLAAGSLSGQFVNIVNNFDNVDDRAIQIEGNIYQVAQAGSLPTSITLGARRVGEAGATSSFNVANVAPVTPGFNEKLSAQASVGGAFRLNGATSTSAIVGAGAVTPVALSLGTGTAGSFNNIVTIANTSLAVAGSGLTDLALAGQSINVSGNVYAAAVVGLSGTSVNFGVVRQGAADPTRSLTIQNQATGALTDQLITTVGGLPALISGTGPGTLNGGQSGTAIFTLDSATAGAVSGSTTLGFASHNSEMSDLGLGSQKVNFTGIVTELATASLFQNGGVGTFGGSGNAYTLDFGTLDADSGLATFDLGILNGNSGMSFSELLGGSFLLNGASFDFSGTTFTALAGQDSDLGNLVKFDTTGLTAGNYSATLTFNGYSSYAGLGDLALSPITLSIKGQIKDGGVTSPPAVPEPASWAMMIGGFAMIGASMRRRKAAASFA